MAHTVRPNDFGKDLGLMHELVIQGRKLHVLPDFYALLVNEPHVFERLIDYVAGQSDLPSATTRPIIAADILGNRLYNNRFDPLGIFTFPFEVPEDPDGTLRNLPFPVSQLYKFAPSKRSAVAFLTPSFSLNTFFGGHSDYAILSDWYKTQSFALDECETTWRLLEDARPVQFARDDLIDMVETVKGDTQRSKAKILLSATTLIIATQILSSVITSDREGFNFWTPTIHTSDAGEVVWVYLGLPELTFDLRPTSELPRDARLSLPYRIVRPAKPIPFVSERYIKQPVDGE